MSYHRVGGALGALSPEALRFLREHRSGGPAPATPGAAGGGGTGTPEAPFRSGGPAPGTPGALSPEALRFLREHRSGGPAPATPGAAGGGGTGTPEDPFRSGGPAPATPGAAGGGGTGTPEAPFRSGGPAPGTPGGFVGGRMPSFDALREGAKIPLFDFSTGQQTTPDARPWPPPDAMTAPVSTWWDEHWSTVVAITAGAVAAGLLAFGAYKAGKRKPNRRRRARRHNGYGKVRGDQIQHGRDGAVEAIDRPRERNRRRNSTPARGEAPRRPCETRGRLAP